VVDGVGRDHLVDDAEVAAVDGGAEALLGDDVGVSVHGDRPPD